MNIQKLTNHFLVATGLAFASITVAHADHRHQRYAEDYDSHRHHHEYEEKHNRKHRHQKDKRHARAHQRKHVDISLEHRYLHKKGIPHRNHLGRAHPHKRWRKQHRRWRYARLQRKYERYSYYNDHRRHSDYYHEPYRSRHW